MERSPPMAARGSLPRRWRFQRGTAGSTSARRSSGGLRYTSPVDRPRAFSELTRRTILVSDPARTRLESTNRARIRALHACVADSGAAAIPVLAVTMAILLQLANGTDRAIAELRFERRRA